MDVPAFPWDCPWTKSTGLLNITPTVILSVGVGSRLATILLTSTTSSTSPSGLGCLTPGYNSS